MKRTTNGFTLIEMLVVVAVIGILAAMIHAGISKTIERAKIANTRTLVMAIDSGMQLFKTDFGHLPYDSLSGGNKTNDREWIRRWLLGIRNNGEPDTSGVRDEQLWTGPYVEIQINKHLGEDIQYVFVDSWGNPIYFETDPNNTEDMVFNPDRWDIWSLGPDEAGTTDMGTITGGSYEIKRDNYKEHTVDNKEVNRDNVGNY